MALAHRPWQWRGRLPETPLGAGDTETIAIDVGCGHGELTLEVAKRCRSVTGFDRVSAFIDKAKALASTAGVTNCTFVLGSSKATSDDKHSARIPVERGSCDLIYFRRGPLSYIHDVKRVAHSGTRIIQLNPAHTKGPKWASLLPAESFPLPEMGEFDILDDVAGRLTDVGLTIQSYWFFDVPEYFDSPQELYKLLAWNFLDQPPCTLSEAQPIPETVFREHSADGKVIVRHRRFLWTCDIP